MKHSLGGDGVGSPSFLAGVVAPWSFLAAGAALSLLDVSPYLNKTAAYLVVIGLGIMAAAYLVSHFQNAMIVRHKP